MKKIFKMLLVMGLFFSNSFSPMNIFAQSYTITFNGTGADASSIPRPKSIMVGTSIGQSDLPVPTRTGYQFQGWLYEGVLVTTLEMPASDIVLRAKWQSEQQLLKFESPLSATTNLPPSSMVDTGSVINPHDFSVPAHERYQFAGWSQNDYIVSATVLVPVGGLLFTAQWTGSTEPLNFDLQGGSSSSFITELHEPVGSKLDLISMGIPEKQGYNFIGWKYRQKLVDTIFIVPEGGATFEAVWELQTENLTLSAGQIEITLEANKKQTLNYVELFKLKAEDKIEGNLTANVTFVDSSLLQDTPGTYTIFAVIKNARKQEVKKALHIHIIDTTAPTIIIENEQVTKIIGDVQTEKEIIELFAITVYDVVDKNQVTTEIKQLDTINEQQPGSYQIIITAIDKSNNTNTMSVHLELLPIVFSGIAYMDENKNGLQDSTEQGVANIEVVLVNGENKKIVETTKTTAKGTYSLQSSQSGDEASTYYVCTKGLSMYMIFPQEETTSQQNFVAETACSNVFEVKGTNYSNIFLGVAPILEVSIPQREVSIVVGSSIPIDVVTTNGKMTKVKVGNNELLEVIQKEEKFYLQGIQAGETELTLYFSDIYGQEQKATKKIKVQVINSTT